MKTKPFPPTFPLLFGDKFVFEKTFPGEACASCAFLPAERPLTSEPDRSIDRSIAFQVALPSPSCSLPWSTSPYILSYCRMTALTPRTPHPPKTRYTRRSCSPPSRPRDWTFCFHTRSCVPPTTRVSTSTCSWSRPETFQGSSRQR